MLRPQIAISSEQMFGPAAWQQSNKYQPIGLAWGLGWGLFDTEQGRAFFHTGHDLGYQNYTVTYPDKGIGIVLLSNSDNFESGDVVAEPGEYDGFPFRGALYIGPYSVLIFSQ